MATGHTKNHMEGHLKLLSKELNVSLVSETGCMQRKVRPSISEMIQILHKCPNSRLSLFRTKRRLRTTSKGRYKHMVSSSILTINRMFVSTRQ